MQSWSLVHDVTRVAPVIKVTTSILHVPNGPLSYFLRKRQTVLIQIPEEHERIDRLGTALNIERQSFVIVVPWRAVGKEECVLPVFVATHHRLVKLKVARAPLVMLKTVEDVARMKVINPLKILFFP